MTQLEIAIATYKVTNTKVHILEYEGWTYISEMFYEDRPGSIYVSGKGLVPLTRPDQMVSPEIFDSLGNFVKPSDTIETGDSPF